MLELACILKSLILIPDSSPPPLRQAMLLDLIAELHIGIAMCSNQDTTAQECLTEDHVSIPFFPFSSFFIRLIDYFRVRSGGILPPLSTSVVHGFHLQTRTLRGKPSYHGSIEERRRLLPFGRNIAAELLKDPRTHKTAAPILLHPDLHKRNMSPKMTLQLSQV